MPAPNFESLVGKTVRFYGVNVGCKFKLGKYVYESVEDPSDGYRSYFQEVILAPSQEFSSDLKKSVKVVIVEVNNTDPKRTEKDATTNVDDGYKLVGEDGHIWLQFGTDNEDGYYPCFVFTYNPKVK